MPDPTREQFESAARKVAATAPDGLSQDDFYALVDKELAGSPAYTQPDRRQAYSSLSDSPEKPFFERVAEWGEGMAQPKSMGDFLSLLIPSKLMSGGAAERGAAAAGRGVEGTGDIMLKAGEASRGRALPAAIAASVATGDARPLAAAAIPPILRTAGRGTSAVGRTMQRERILTSQPVRKVMGEVVEDAASTLPHGAQEGSFTEVLPKGLPEAKSTQLAGSDLEDKMLGMVDEAQTPPESTSVPKAPEQAPEPESVIDYSPDEPLESSGQVPDPNTMLAETGAESMPLGKPRVTAWKSGHGPSDGLIGQLRDEAGTKDAAHRLAIPQAQVRERAPRMSPRGLPPEATQRIEEAMAGMTPEEKLVYLESAPNGLSENFIQTLLKR